MNDQLRFKKQLLIQYFLVHFFQFKGKKCRANTRQSIAMTCLCLSMLMLGLTSARAQSFDQQYAAWKQKQQWHDQQFQQSNAKHRGSDNFTTSQFKSSGPSAPHHPAAASPAHEQLSLNQATADQLQQHLTGIGQKKAQAIIEQRQKMGGFKRIEDLLDVKGIGEKTLEKNRHKLRL